MHKKREGVSKNFEVGIEEGVISLALRGKIGGLNLFALKEWSSKVSDLVRKENAKLGRGVPVVIDVGGLQSYEPEALSVVAALMHDDAPFVYRTATYGASPAIRLAEDAVFSLSGRDNCRAFATKEEAFQWVKE